MSTVQNPDSYLPSGFDPEQWESLKKLPETISFASLEEAESILKPIRELAWSYYYDDNQQRMYDAFLIFQLLADCDDTCGLDMVGQMLYSGKGCEKDYSAAIPYLRKAADAGASISQHLLGDCYDQGLGIEKNEEGAIKYFELAALQDNPLAQYDLARIYHLKFIASKKVKQQSSVVQAESMIYLMAEIHWLCCAHLNKIPIEEATKRLQNMISDSDLETAEAAKSLIEGEIAQIQKEGIVPRTLWKDQKKVLENRLTGSSETSATSKSEGCYIATAVYGSYDASEVITLRKFRDNVLKQHILGRLFIRLYYTFSPPVAEKLKNNSRVNAFVKHLLNCLVNHIRN